jgi:outer membrane protein TolC
MNHFKVRETLESLYVWRLGLLGIVLLVSPVLSKAQETDLQTLSLSLDQAISLATEQNFDLRASEVDEKIARSELRKSNAVFLPQISVEETAVSTNDPLSAFGFKLKQEIVQQSDFNPALLNDPDVIDNFTTKVQVQQPVLNLDGMMGRRALKKRYQASKAQSERTRYFTNFQVTQAYYGLILAQRRITVINQALEVARAHRKQAMDFYEQGMVNKADLLAAEVRLNELETQYTQSTHAAENSMDQLRFMLNVSDERVIVPTEELSKQAAPDVRYDMQEVNNRRSDMQALQFQLDATRSNLNAMRFRFLPSFNVFGSYEWNDESLLGTGADNYMIGATLKWNLFSGYKNVGSIEQASAQLSRIRLALEKKSYHNRIELNQAERAITQAISQIELTESSIQQAEEQLRIRQNRYDEGMEKTTDVLMAETQLSEARLRHLQALYQLKISIAHMELLLEADLAR